MLLRIDFGNPTLSVSCCLMGPGRKGRGDGVDGPSPVTAGGGEGAVQLFYKSLSCMYLSPPGQKILIFAKRISMILPTPNQGCNVKRNSIVAPVYQKY